MKTIESEMRVYRPAIAIDRIISLRVRHGVVVALSIVIGILTLIILGFVFRDSVELGYFDIQKIFESTQYVTALLCVIIAPYFVLVQLVFFYNTFYFRGVENIVREDLTDEEGILLEVAVLCATDKTDLTRGFLVSVHGQTVMARLGSKQLASEQYLASTRACIDPFTMPLTQGTFLTLQDVGEYVYANDETFREFLFKQGITEELFKGANEWISRVMLNEKYTTRWWSRDNLGKFRGVGRELSYGIAAELTRYARDIQRTSLSFSFGDAGYANEIIKKVETILTRTKAANVLMVGEPGVGKMDMLIELGMRMREGHSVSSLTAKRLVVFDVDAFIATHNSKEAFEYEFLRLMTQVERAGNIIIVIENLASFLASVSVLGVNAGELLGRFLTSSEVQIVATVDPSNYHQSLESNGQLLQFFETVTVETPDLASVIRVLEEIVPRHEYRHKITFTYPALVRVAECADQYIINDVMPNKAVNFLSEVASRAEQQEIGLVDGSFVNECIKNKTGIPTGAIIGEERELLMNLETALHKRVVGQHTAIDAIASAIRRARAGIQNTNRPVSSFLFIGPTGVGKTETAKALAYTMFGSEERMIRFDMTEFSDASSLSRLIGTTKDAGELSSALREHPYGVLLLDELEKASEEVHDLFLQILDEGRFTDARGMLTNARNIIIIATSNAGSDMIWNRTQDVVSSHDAKEDIINSIIERHIFKPEFINRFDAVVLFDSLNEGEQQEIAQLMLRELQMRIRNRGYELVVNDVLLDVLIKEGYDPQFGARPMRRAIQDTIESKVARKIIAGSLRRGDKIEFESSDFV